MKYQNKKQIFYIFTLVELLVAMSVFSILLVLMLQFFSGAQKMWTGMEEKNNLYADARVAMDLMSTLLQSTYYSAGGTPFIIENPNTDNSKIYFAAQSKMDNLPGTKDIRFISFQRTGTHNEKLVMAIFADNGTDDSGPTAYSYFFPPYGEGAVTSYEVAKNLLVTKLDNKVSTTQDDNSAIVLNNVTGLRFIPFARMTTGGGSEIIAPSGNKYDRKPPYLIEIQLSLMDKKNFDTWRNLPTAQQDAFRQQHERTFTRAVFLGGRWAETL